MGKPEKLSQAEIESLLESNSGGRKWKKAAPLEVGFGKEGWLLEDKSALALYLPFENRLIFTDMGYSEIQQKNQKAREQENLDGF